MTRENELPPLDRNGVIESMLAGIELPELLPVVQRISGERLEDPEAVLASELDKSEIAGRLRSGMRVAVTVGSRGIAGIARCTAALVQRLKAAGAEPFVVPAMGSHGGATAEGQRRLLAGLGVTEERVGAPIVASMETVLLGETEEGRPVYIDARAAEADGIVVMNRVKPHTAFRGTYESGLLKMMAIGLGKHDGAMACHADGYGRMAEQIPAFGRVVLARAPILFGLAIVENGRDELYRIEAVPPEEIFMREPQLLREAFALMPAIPFRSIDVLVVRRIGKNISGLGMDPNITGIFSTPYAHGGPEVGRCVVLDLTAESEGNGAGIGLADFTTARLFSRLDLDAMYPNSLTSTVVSTCKLPMIMKDEETAVKAALLTAPGCDRRRPRVVMIRDTAHLERLWVSRSLINELELANAVEGREEPKPAGDPCSWWQAARQAEGTG